MSLNPEEKTPLSRLGNGTYDVAPKTDWQKSIVERNAHESPLLRLPRELRDLIWTFTFTRTIKPNRKETPPNFTFSPLVACRQIYAEAASPAYPLLTWSFYCWPNYEDWFWKLHNNQVDKDKIMKIPIRFIQIGVDPTDLYHLAEVEDPGSDDEDEELERDEDEYHRPTFRVFKNLSHLELLLSATEVYADSDFEYDNEGEIKNDEVTRYDDTFIEEAKENFTRTMKRKVPHVRVTYRDFGTVDAMREYWREQDPWHGSSVC